MEEETKEVLVVLTKAVSFIGRRSGGALIALKRAIRKSRKMNKGIAFFLTLLLSVAAQAEYFIGLANVYTYPANNVSITIEFPLEFKGLLVNWSNEGFNNFPDRFVISDGTSKRDFILVDKSKGSKLAAYIAEIRSNMAAYYDRQNPTLLTQPQILSYLIKYTQKYIQWKTETPQTDVVLYSPLDQYSFKLLGLPIGQWYETKAPHRASPFTDILDGESGVCIDMVLLASFVLESFNIKHKTVFGSVQNNDYGGGGHTWIELIDGRILDVAWKTLGKPQLKLHPVNKDWLWFGNEIGFQYRFPYRFFPIIKLK